MSSSNQHGTAASALASIYDKGGSGSQLSDSDKNTIAVSRRLMQPAAVPLLNQLGISGDMNTPVHFLDNGCGSGVATAEAQARIPAAILRASSFTCGDVATGMVELVKRRIEVEGWVNAKAKILDATNPDLPDDSFTHIGMAMAMHVIPEPFKTLKECKRMLKPGGIMGMTTFHTKSASTFWYDDVRTAFASLPFDAPFPTPFPLQMNKQGHWSDETWVEKHLREEQQLEDVQVNLHDGKMPIQGADDFLSTFWSMVVWIMNGWWNEETRREHPAEEVRELVKKHLEEKYGGKGWELGWMLICATGRVNK